MSSENPTKDELHEEAMGTKSTEKRPLWAVAAEEFDPRKGKWELIIRYNHSTHEAQARATYCLSRPPAIEYKIIYAARVIGYHVNDNKGIKLAV